MRLQEVHLDELFSRVGSAEPTISGSSASLIAARIGVAMVRMAFAVSGKHSIDNDMAIEKLDSISVRLVDAGERDREAALTLITALRDGTDETVHNRALTDATREPLVAAHLLVELLEHCDEAEPGIRKSVASDFFGGVELISGAFAGVMMAVEANLQHETADDLGNRTRQNRRELYRRHDVAVAALRCRPLALGLRRS